MPATNSWPVIMVAEPLKPLSQSLVQQQSIIDGGGPLFDGTPESQTVWESHNDEVVELPEGFRITASSESCEIQAMENSTLDRFDPISEVNDSEYGAKIFENS